MTAVRTATQGPIFTVTLNRPEQRNAWNQAMVDGLEQAWIDFEASDALVCVVNAEGPSFSAGLDFRDPPKSDDGALPNLAVPCNKPIIVATEGACLGMACSFVLMCDMVVSGESAYFAYLEAKMGLYGGLMAGFAGRFLYRPGLQWMMTGDKMGAERAYEIGMINEVVPDGTALERAMAIANQIAENAPLVIQSMKSVAMKTLPMGPAETYYRDLRMLDAIKRSEDFAEGVAALREGRKAKFKGR
jgi:enoyl-CoA hydratase/carnithine racemase